MEFNFSIETLLPSRLTIVESKHNSQSLAVSTVKLLENANMNEVEEMCVSILKANDVSLRKKLENLARIIDQMGLASAKAQDLLSPITTFEKLLNSSQQKLYIMRETTMPHSVIGILKTGLKRLFICDDYGVHHEVNATCVLDFYVHESKQRCGFGYELFHAMLKCENIEPSKLAIDRPSFKFLEFLKKHYNLTDPKPQANKFVIYSDFFGTPSSPSSCSGNNQSSNSSFTKSGTPLKVNTPISSFKDLKNTPTGNCHNKIEANSRIDAYFRKRRSAFNQNNETPPQCLKNERKGGMYDVLHSYSSSFDDYSEKQTNQCSLTPVRNENMHAQKKWNQLQSSWNVLGVKPRDYSMDYTSS